MTREQSGLWPLRPDALGIGGQTRETIPNTIATAVQEPCPSHDRALEADCRSAVVDERAVKATSEKVEAGVRLTSPEPSSEGGHITRHGGEPRTVHLLIASGIRDRLRLIAIPFEEAAEFVTRHHRHHARPAGHKFSLGAILGGKIVGVAIVGRPVSRIRDDGRTLEVSRLTTDGTRNACSFLYGAAAKATFALGYARLGTYILKSESGTSLRAAGWKLVAETSGRSWNCPSRPRVDRHPTEDKLLFEVAP